VANGCTENPYLPLTMNIKYFGIKNESKIHRMPIVHFACMPDVAA
jgi:hypothetical protein